MIIGSGLIAQSLFGLEIPSDFCVFASGVSNSKCIDNQDFLRERNLLHDIIQSGKRIIYFSSQAASRNIDISPYYSHKRDMEDLILSSSADSCIIRLPQVCGPSSNERQLIGFLFKCINEGRFFNCYRNSVRNIILASNLNSVVAKSIKNNFYGVYHFCSPFDFFVHEVVDEIEYFCAKSAIKRDVIEPHGIKSVEYLCSNEFLELQYYYNTNSRAQYLRFVISSCLDGLKHD